jgi:putative membrane protein
MRSATHRILTPSVGIGAVVGLVALGAAFANRQVIAAPALDDATIVAIFDAANGYDIETGVLAARKGSSDDVREFGEMLARDHQHVRTLGRDLAKSLHVTPTPPKDFALAKSHVEAMRTLKAATGRQFDRAFLKHEVDFHSAVIDAITTSLLPAIENAQVRELVTKVAPAFVAHRDKAQSMLDRMK